MARLNLAITTGLALVFAVSCAIHPSWTTLFARISSLPSRPSLVANSRIDASGKVQQASPEDSSRPPVIAA